MNKGQDGKFVSVALDNEFDKLKQEIELLIKSRDYSRLVCEEQSKEIVELKKEIEDLKMCTAFKWSGENQKLRELVERATKFESHAHWCLFEDDIDCNCGFEAWCKEASEALK